MGPAPSRWAMASATPATITSASSSPPIGPVPVTHQAAWSGVGTVEWPEGNVA